MKTPQRHFNVPGCEGLTIDAIYAWVVTEPDGGEGIPAFQDGIGRVMPLVGADIDRVKSLRMIAERMHRDTGYPIKLVRFSKREILEELP